MILEKGKTKWDPWRLKKRKQENPDGLSVLFFILLPSLSSF